MDYFNTIEINKKNLLHNLTILKKLQPQKEICAMVKADAYGHGIKDIVLILKKYVSYFGVANCIEALKVRNLTKTNHILLCGLYNKERLIELIENDISLTIFTFKHLNEIIRVCKKLNKKAKIHIKLNTGMNRLGIKNKAYFKRFLDKIYANSKYIILEGVYSHFFASDCSKGLTENQYFKFIDFINLIPNRDCINIHIENSAGFIHHADKFNVCSMARIGITLYGYNPTDIKINLKPVLTLKSKLIAINNLKPSEYVGYGNKFITSKKIKIGVIPLGYYDGLLRKYVGSFVLINDIPCQIVAVCMDMTLINITNANAKVDDIVTLFGENERFNLDAEYIAEKLDTISYEILTNLKHERMNFKVI